MMRWLGGISLLVALLVVLGATLLGVILTLLASQEPGALLGVFVIIGSLAAILGVRRNAVYLLFPLPALSLFVGALMTGVVHDSALASTTAGLGAGSLQWFAGIFFPMVIGTVVVLLVGGGRWLFGSQFVTGRPSLPSLAPAPVAARPGTGPHRSPASASDSWAADDPFASGNQGTGPTPGPGTGPTPRQGTGPAPRPGTGPTPRPGTGPTPRPGTGTTPRPGAGGNRPPRPARDPRTDRDPWGDPRLPAERQPPAGPRPRPPGPAPQPQPRDRPPRPQPGPSWSPPASPRPPRPQPPEGWN